MPLKPRWQVVTLNAGNLLLTGVIAATTTVILYVTCVSYGVAQGMWFFPRILLFFSIFVGLTAIFYAIWNWAFFDHPYELRRKLPTTSKQMRRERKDFFDDLP